MDTDQKSIEREFCRQNKLAIPGAFESSVSPLLSPLRGRGIRLGQRSLQEKTTAKWILEQGDWTDLQKNILVEHLANIAESKERRQRLYRLIAAEMSADPMMMRCMKILGVGIVSAFALLAVIGDIRRFHSPEKLVAYIGLNPGQRQSGKGKDIRLGVGKRGRGDIRHLLIQGAQAVLRSGRHTVLGQWGCKLFARKGNRNLAASAVARKLLVQVWHMLQGNPPIGLESDKSFRLKLTKLAVVLGTAARREAGLGQSLADSVNTLIKRCLHNSQPVPA